MSATIREVVDSATVLIGEVAGVGVQQFDDDVLYAHAIRAFDLLWKKYHWPQFREWRRVELDGVTGKFITNDFDDIRDFEDFVAVHIDAEPQGLPTLNKATNPYTLGTGTRPKLWTSLPIIDTDYDDKRLLIYPLTATGFLNVCVRIYPVIPPAINWGWDDTMHLDKNMLVYGTGYMALVGSAMNGEGAEMCKGLMQMTFDNVTNGLGNQPIAIEHQDSVPDQWFVQNP